MGSNVSLCKYNLGMHIKKEGLKVKPCLVVFRKNYYRVSSWRDFFKIMYCNNVEHNKDFLAENFQKDVNRFIAGEIGKLVVDNADNDPSFIKVDQSNYVHCYSDDNKNLVALWYATKNYGLEYDLYFVKGEKDAFDNDEYAMVQNEAIASLDPKIKYREKKAKYYIAHINSKLFSKKEKFCRRVEREFDHKKLIGDISINEKEEVILKEIMIDELKSITSQGHLIGKYGKVFAFGLVRYAMKYYNRNTFWRNFIDEYGIEIKSSRDRSIIGDSFEAIMKRNGKAFIDSDSRANHIQNIAMHAFVCNKCADQFFDYIFDFWRLDLNRSIENIKDGQGNDLFGILIDEIAANENNSVQDIMIHTSMALKQNKRGVKNRVRRILRMIDTSFFDDADYSESLNRIAVLLEAWKKNPKSRFSIEYNRSASERRNGRREKLLSSPTILFNQKEKDFTLKLPKETLRLCERDEYPVWEIEIGNQKYDVTPDLMEGRASLFAAECGFSLSEQDIFEEIRIVLKSDKRQYYKSVIQSTDVRFFTSSFKHTTPTGNALIKDVAYAFLKNPSKLEKIGSGAISTELFSSMVTVVSLNTKEGELIILPNGKALSVGMVLADGLVGASVLNGAKCRYGEIDYDIYTSISSLFFSATPEKMNGTVVKIFENGKNLFAGKLSGVNYKSIKFDDQLTDAAGYLIDLKSYIKHDGLYKVTLDIPGYNLRDYNICFVENLEYSYLGSPYVLQSTGTFALSKNVILKQANDWEDLGICNKLTFTFGKVHEDDADDYVVDGKLQFECYVSRTLVLMQFDIPLLYWKFSLEDNWSYEKPDMIAAKRIPDRIYVKGDLPLADSKLFVNDELRDETESGIQHDKEHDCYYFRKVDFIDYIDREKQYRNLSISIGENEYDFIDIVCRSRVENADITGDFLNNKLYGKFEIIGSSDYYVSISHKGEIIEPEVPIKKGQFEIELPIESGEYIVKLYEVEEDEDGFGEESFELATYKVKLVDVWNLEDKRIAIRYIKLRNRHLQLDIQKDRYFIRKLKRLDYKKDIRDKVSVYSWLYESDDEDSLSKFLYYKGVLTYETANSIYSEFEVLAIFDNHENTGEVLLFVLDGDEAYEPIVDRARQIILKDSSEMSRIEKRKSAVSLYDDVYIVRVRLEDDAYDKEICPGPHTAYLSKKIQESGYRLKIAELKLSERTKRCLDRAGYKWLEELGNKQESDLYKVRNLGAKCVAEVKVCMAKYGISFRN